MTDKAESAEGSGIVNWRSELRLALEKHFSEEDVELLCFDLNVPYDNLSGTNLPLKIVSLITYLSQRGRITELIDACSKQRENVDWEALKQAAIADPTLEGEPETSPAETSAQEEERPETVATEVTSVTDEQAAAGPTAGRSVRALIGDLPRWTLYVAAAIVLILAGLMLARFVFSPAEEPSGTREGTSEPLIAEVTEAPPSATDDQATAEPGPTPLIDEEDGASGQATPAVQESPSPSATASPSATPTAGPTASPTHTATATATPTIALVAGVVDEREIDGMRMRYVPGGSFQMGSEKERSDEWPVHPVTLSAFWIDEKEVSNAQYGMCVDDGFCDERSLGSAASSDLAQPNHPAIRVTYDDARRYCQWVGGDLPTEAQWEYAARGTDGRPYPWGADDPECDLAQAKFEDICEPDATAPVGSFPGGNSWVGALDMAGNVYEWCLDWYGRNYYQDEASRQPDPTGPEQGQTRVIRGGSWLVAAEFPRAAHRSRTDPGVALDVIGFRCVVPGKDSTG